MGDILIKMFPVDWEANYEVDWSQHTLSGSYLDKDISRCKANYEVDWALDAICLGDVLMKIFPVVLKPITKLIGPVTQFVSGSYLPCGEKSRVMWDTIQLKEPVIIDDWS